MVECKYTGFPCDYGGSPETVGDCTDCPTFLNWERKSIEADLRDEYDADAEMKEWFDL